MDALPPPPPPMSAVALAYARLAGNYSDLPNEHFRDAALTAGEIGPVFPVLQNAKSPPLLSNFPNVATRDPVTILQWWTLPDGSAAGHNPAIATGGGLFVVDIDIPGDEEAIDKVCEELGLDLNTYRVRTPSGGLHLYYRASGIRNSVKRVHPRVDIRGEHGYVLAAGAVTSTGRYVAL